MTFPDPQTPWGLLPADGVGHWTWRVGSDELHWDDAHARLMGAAPGESPAQCWQRVVDQSEQGSLGHAANHRSAILQLRIDDGRSPARYVLHRATHIWHDEVTGHEWRRGISADVTDWTATAQASNPAPTLEHQATHDPLTQLPNEAFVMRAAQTHLDSSKAAAATFLAVDLDRFMLVNDALGRGVGDQLLLEVAQRLAAATGAGDLLARCGGDEFLILLADADPSRAELVAQRVLDAVRKPLSLEGNDLHVTASVGLASTNHPDAERRSVALRRDADLAVHEAKRAGRDQWAWFGSELRSRVARVLGVERDLRAALASEGQLALHYQPTYSLSTGHPVGVEGLLRWTHPERGQVAPFDVVAIAEETGLIVPLGAWVLTTAIDQAARWADRPGFTTWFNVSPRQLIAGDVPRDLLAALARTGLPANRIGIEVTESVFADGSPALAALEEIASFGIKIAIDDFGTGYSSLSRLLTMPVDLVKIDRSFVVASSTPAGRAVLEGVVNLAHGIGAKVVAEGVETATQLTVLRTTPCDHVGGWLFSPARPASAVPLGRIDLHGLTGHPFSEWTPRVVSAPHR